MGRAVPKHLCTMTNLCVFQFYVLESEANAWQMKLLSFVIHLFDIYSKALIHVVMTNFIKFSATINSWQSIANWGRYNWGPGPPSFARKSGPFLWVRTG